MYMKSYEKHNKSLKSRGFSLIELIIIMAILSIISSVAVPKYIHYIEYSKAKVCSVNRQQLVKMYHTYLLLNNQQDSNVLFDKYIQENGQNICPKQGTISTLENNIQCDIHCNGGQNEEKNGEEIVPYL